MVENPFEHNFEFENISVSILNHFPSIQNLKINSSKQHLKLTYRKRSFQKQPNPLQLATSAV